MADSDSFAQLMQDYVGLRDATTNLTNATLHPLNHTNAESAACSTREPPTVAGFEPTQPDHQYWFHADLNLWYDATTRVYSVYDSATTTYVPVNIADYCTAASTPTAGSAAVAENAVAPHDWTHRPATNAMDNSTATTSSTIAPTDSIPPDALSAATLPPLLRLVVLESATLPPGQVATISVNGVTVGRDRVPTGLRLRIPEMTISRYHADIFCQASPDQVSFVDPFTSSSATSDAKGVQGSTSHQGSASPPTASLQDSSSASDRENGELDDDMCNQGPDSYDQLATDDHRYHETQPLSPRVPLSHQFWVVDCGSQHGTFVNNRRLSNPKEASQPVALQHGDTLAFGATVFSVHQHLDSKWGCCQQCLLQATNQIPTADSTSEPSSHVQHVASTSSSQIAPHSSSQLTLSAPETSRVGPGVILSAPPQRAPQPLSPVTTDSKLHSTTTAWPSAARRNTHRHWSRSYNQISHSYASTQPPSKQATARTPPKQSLPPTSVAQTVMEKMGWSHGQGLGKHQSGVKEPIALAMRPDRVGLGFGGTSSSQLPTLPVAESTTALDPVQAAKRARIQRLTAHRYYQASND
ncbi:hypothetical protein H4R35_001992 [Dimargaris xerosporica]|nr:hypothetical protein H4R35_001992 [Dimargaris xerosporica]